MSDVIYPEGIRTFAPNDKAPDFVLGNVIISLNELFAYAKAHPELLSDYKGEKQLKLNCTKRKDGKGITLSVDTWKSDKKQEPEQNNIPEPNELPF